jgi:hypothetical protein
MVAQAPSTDRTTDKSPGSCQRIPFRRKTLIAIPLLIISTGIICTGCRTEIGGTGILTRYDDRDDSCPKLSEQVKKQFETDLEKEP